jgi:hypothetical protein
MARTAIIQVGEALYGPRFQRELAKDLGVNERTMRRWVAGDTAPPDRIGQELAVLIAKRVELLSGVRSILELPA